LGKIIDGKAISAAIREEMKDEVAAMKREGITPGLAVVLVGEDPASAIYVRNKERACDNVGLYSWCTGWMRKRRRRSFYRWWKS